MLLTPPFILTHWISDVQLIMETDASDYTLITIISIINEKNEVYPVAFHSRTFTSAKLNYNTYDKKLLVSFEAFQIWYHYLKDLDFLINIVTDYKNLEYFSITKIFVTIKDLKY